MKELWNNLKFAWKYAKDQKIRLIFYILFNCVAVAISIGVPIISAQVIINLTNSKFTQLLIMSAILMGVEVLRNFVNFATAYFSQVIYRETFTKIQSDLGKEILRLENKSLDENSSGVFIQRLTNDTGRIAEIFNVLNMHLSNIITDVGIFGAVFIINKIAFFYLAFMVFIIYIVEKKRVNYITEQDKIYRKEHEKTAGFVGELVRGARDIKMLSAEDSFMRELKKKVTNLNNFRYSISSEDRKYNLLRDCLYDLFNGGMIFLLVFLIIDDNLAVASALVIHDYMGRVTSIVSFVSMLLERVKDFNLSSSRIFSIIKGEDFKKEHFGKKHLDKVEGDFEFKNVTFAYNDGEKVLDDISFKVNANETVAFVGKSGAGKSTIFSLLCKMYDVNSGIITIDGEDINTLDRESIRDNITIISQNPYIFNMSIRDNLKLVKDNLTDEEMFEACRMACLDEFIEKLPDGYDTVVGEGGVNLSGGQRQRLAIARAFVQKTEIILFDEATSALDNETQEAIQEAINNLQKDYTIMIIAHRLSTVVNSDRILFLNEGKIEAMGTHKELLKKCENYKHLYEAEMEK
ncbi:MAG: ABC transporter ATP-binding protein [Bacilli bacterium]|nr:ABC transporter ATP-binding protein [Bacilli bacterium]